MTSFRTLHDGPSLLILANCWDAGSARVIQQAGARALATTSAGVAWACGYPDGDQLPTERLIAVVRAITRIVSLPLTVDAEGGYDDDPGSVAETIAALIDAGAVGVNLEDGRSPPELLARKIEAARTAATRAGVDLFVNARTDVYLSQLATQAERVTETLRRARIYREAGADGLFVPAVIDREEIRALAAGAGLPLNVLAWKGLPPASELLTLGVRRLSSGASIPRHALGRVAELAEAFLRDGSSDVFDGPAPGGGALDELFSRPARVG